MITTILIAAMALATRSPAAEMRPAVEDYSLEVLVNGAPLREYTARGKTYIEALEGEEYSIRLRNQTGGRIAVALSVDGLNTIDATTTSAREAAKWILDPHQTLTLDGWQTSSAAARRFFFTTEKESYGAWLGKTQNLGTISAAVFRERGPRTLISRESGKMRSGTNAPRAGESRMEPRRQEAGRDLGARAEANDYAATGIGEKFDHRVTRVAFEAEETPASVLTIRYEYHEALLELGVLPRPGNECDDSLARRERARGFEDTGFAPDPYGTGCR